MLTSVTFILMAMVVAEPRVVVAAGGVPANFFHLKTATVLPGTLARIVLKGTGGGKYVVQTAFPLP